MHCPYNFPKSPLHLNISILTLDHRAFRLHCELHSTKSCHTFLATITPFGHQCYRCQYEKIPSTSQTLFTNYLQIYSWLVSRDYAVDNNSALGNNACKLIDFLCMSWAFAKLDEQMEVFFLAHASIFISDNCRLSRFFHCYDPLKEYRASSLGLNSMCSQETKTLLECANSFPLETHSNFNSMLQSVNI